MFEETFLESLSEERLQAIGIRDTPKAFRLLKELAGQGVSDDDIAPLLPSLLQALSESPDPDRALSGFGRWFDAVSSRYSHLQTLLRHPVALRVFCLVAGASQYFSDILARQPEYFEILSNPGMRGGEKSAVAFYHEIHALVESCHQPVLKRDALRRWKAREMLRIGVRDLVGLSDMAHTAREFSNLADACVQAAYDIALSTLPLAPSAPPIPFAVIGMGKLGGQELNYSSDIDLIFVHGDDLPDTLETAEGRQMETPTYLRRFAETLIKNLADESANGHVFRVDMRLRPEGRFGPITRSLSGCRAYYESWAESWEWQALLKARFLAGDRALGEAYMALIAPYVYRPHVTVSFLQDIRDNKQRIEKTCALEGNAETDIKRGVGGIRDVEFTAQLFQLELGGRHPNLRTPNTLHALERLRQARLLTEQEAQELAEDYRFLRDLEHRLQLLNGFQTQSLPPASNALERYQVARRMGFSDRESFEAELTQRRERVNRHFQHLFYRDTTQNKAESDAPPKGWHELNDLLDMIDTPAAQSRLSEMLTSAGFYDLPNALRTLHLPMRGNDFGEMPPDTPLEFKSIAPRLMALCALSPDPDAALAGIESLAQEVPNRAQLYASFDDSPEIMARLVQLGAVAPPLMKRLTRRTEWLETLLNSEEVTETLSYREQISERLRGAKVFDSQLERVGRFHQREFLRIGAKEVWGEADALETMRSLTELADAVLEALLEICTEALASTHSDPQFARLVGQRMAVVGLGKLGGAELGYQSDWDIVFVYDETRLEGEAFSVVNALAERVLSAGKTLAQQGAHIEMDLRLRPWGRAGALVYSFKGFLQYYKEAGETWERQAALKARFAAGNQRAGRRFVRILQAISFGRGATAQEDATIQHMKRRIESERLKPNERETDLKLGFGGLSDVEWLAQRLQILNGKKTLSLRVPNTVRALSTLATERLLDNAEADTLTANYLLLTRLRNLLWLYTQSNQNSLPETPRIRRVLARALGYADTSKESAEARLSHDLASYRKEARRIFQYRFFEN